MMNKDIFRIIHTEIILLGFYPFPENLWIIMNFNRKICIEGVLYRPPVQSLIIYIDAFGDRLSFISSRFENVIV